MTKSCILEGTVGKGYYHQLKNKSQYESSFRKTFLYMYILLLIFNLSRLLCACHTWLIPFSASE